MKIVIEILFMLVLGTLFYQDLKERKISVWVIILGIVLGGIVHFIRQDNVIFMITIGVNILFVLLFFIIIWLYAKLKMKKKLFDVFGEGDLLFFLLLAVSLPTLSFLMVFVFSLIFSLLVYLLLNKKFTNNTVPLAGLQSVFLALVLIIGKFFTSVNIYTL